MHSFTQSGLGPFFIGFLLLVIAGRRSRWSSAGCRSCAREHELESFFSREAAFLFNNLILVGIAFAVFWGTIFPVISEWVRGVKITVGPPFFNRVNAPLGIALLFLMGVGPVIAWRRATPRNLWRSFACRSASALVGGRRAARCSACATRGAWLAFSLGVFVLGDDRAASSGAACARARRMLRRDARRARSRTWSARTAGATAATSSTSAS